MKGSLILPVVHSLKETLFLECMDYQHLTRDRSLGYAELRLGDLAAEADSEDYPFKSTGKKVEASNLRFDKGIFKGQLHYEAEFIPALALKDFGFSTGGNSIQHAVDGNGSDATSVTTGDGSMSSSDIEAEAVPAGITARGPLGIKKEDRVENKGSTDTSLSADDDLDANSAIESSTESEGKDRSGKGVVLSKEELMRHRKFRCSSLSLSRLSKFSSRFQNPESSSSTSQLPSCRRRLVSRFC